MQGEGGVLLVTGPGVRGVMDEAGDATRCSTGVSERVIDRWAGVRQMYPRLCFTALNRITH